MFDPPFATTARWTDQRWLIDGIIEANGIDWDQPRSLYWNAPCGTAAAPDFRMVRERVKKLGDIAGAFEAQAERRERSARDALGEKRLVAARENFFIAAVHWGAAQWPIFKADDRNRRFEWRKHQCFSHYARLADHPVETVSIPIPAGELPAWLHLPPGHKGGRLPVVVLFPGMDSFKEAGVSLYGDPLLSRGFAVLSIDGPGEYSAALGGVYLTVENWQAAGRACVDYLTTRTEIDAARIAVAGRSFGSFGATIAAAAEPRFCAVAVSATCFAPGFEPLCQSASPTFKVRLMYMANIADEATFDDFRRSLDWTGRTGTIEAPFLCVAGEQDELSPLDHAERLMASLSGPRRLVVYEGSRHSVGLGAPSAELGPNVNELVGDWLTQAVAGEFDRSDRWFVDSRGEVTKSTLSRPGTTP